MFYIFAIYIYKLICFHTTSSPTKTKQKTQQQQNEISKKGYAYSFLKQNVVTLSSTTLQQQDQPHNPKQQRDASPLVSQTNSSEHAHESLLSSTGVRSVSATTNYNASLNNAHEQTARAHTSAATSSANNANVADVIDTKSIASGRKSFQYEIVDKPTPLTSMNKQTQLQQQQQLQQQLQRQRSFNHLAAGNHTLSSTNLRSASLVSSLSNVSSASPLLNYLQYGDVLIKCNSLSR